MAAYATSAMLIRPAQSRLTELAWASDARAGLRGCTLRLPGRTCFTSVIPTAARRVTRR